MNQHIHLILSAQALMTIEQTRGEAAFSEKFKPDFEFPDGSLYYSSEEMCEEIHGYIKRERLYANLDHTIGKSCPLFPSPFRLSIFYPRSYERELGEVFVAGYSDSDVPAPHELKNPVTLVVEFKKPPGEAVQTRYLQYVRTWAKSVGEDGIAGEGPARVVSAEVTFSDRWCWFEVDASRSGPHTLNWLILVHLNFGIDVWPISDVCFNPSQRRDARVQYPLAATEVAKPLDQTPNGPVDLPAESERADPPETVYAWEYGGLVDVETPFPVEFQDDDLAWAETHIRITFASIMPKSWSKAVRELVLSWIRLADLGGFGDDGIKGYDLPNFSDDHRTVEISGNFEGSEMELCIHVLMNALRHVHRNGLPVERVEFWGETW